MAGTCDYCHSRPKRVEAGKVHAYCSKTCASKAKTDDCQFCHAKPKAPGHQYCGKTCAGKANASGGAGQGKPFDTSTACLMCKKAPKQGQRNFCSKYCADSAESQAPLLLDVPSSHVTYKSVANQLHTSWKHTNRPSPRIKKIYKIVESHTLRAKYEAYKTKVEGKGHFEAKGMSPGNECRRWHGAHRGCKIGESGQTQLCSGQGCPICSIIRTSYDLQYSGNNFGWLRFGLGIYTSATSSKADDYICPNGPRPPVRALLLNTVVVGKGKTLTLDARTLTAPPAGFDSVLGEPKLLGSLNFDETVVYNNDAIRPSFLVIYDG
ncbi:hypothetical protein SERLADRAFT_417846 [Serpula lacrymans var. lacrymans S7.9]|uniref:PARP catalytic domain-containing protein n=1 Tax=Serpula lacrymans var. lacrymans (strain S7.9) TaxID=578457 RepID=F8P8E1_SERL9|nr:uncharacterized protein SERLADRAFT_417846 [Serpula lacrymans var. lacrymans S7.9]EGO20697.1 hypothetical protein SERLADRAFT_417846 [Serpula lacrymans var. lacrymans S7.9]